MNTTSAFISFHGKLEDQVKEFYEGLAGEDRFKEGRELFQTLSRENNKHKDMILRSYREVITDALEAAFPHNVLDESDYRVNTEIQEGLNLSGAIKKAIKVEETSRRYCGDVSESLHGLLADVPDAFEWVSGRKTRRKKKLETLSSQI